MSMNELVIPGATAGRHWAANIQVAVQPARANEARGRVGQRPTSAIR